MKNEGCWSKRDGPRLTDQGWMLNGEVELGCIIELD